MANKVVAVRKDDTGSIYQYKLDDGTVLDHAQAVAKTERGEIDGCSTFTTRNGDTAIRSDRGQENYSLSKLPSF